jgi:uncharacterized protein (TIGR03663 family)
MSRTAFCTLFLAVLIIGLAFRLGRLNLRPMHHDEANEAVKFGMLLETGEYHYDKKDHHGPTLYYLTLPSAWVRGQKSLAALDEWTLRAVPAAFGLGTILLFVFLAKGLGRGAVVLSALFAALSPVLTYYSRFYIQESLFAFFALGFLIALGRYALRPRAGWALAAGIFAGLAYATKETCIIIFAAAGAGCVLALISARGIHHRAHEQEGKGGESDADAGRVRRRIEHALTGLGGAVFIAVIFYSSFFRYPGEILESVRAFQGYMARSAEPGFHAHPWYYYVQMLAFSSSGGLVWTEGTVLVLALIGMGFALKKARAKSEPNPTSAEQRFWLLYLCFYSLLTAVTFSAIRYKTPWNVLSFYIGFILLAGCGAAELLRRVRSSHARKLFLIALLAGCCHLGIQNWYANFRYPADPRNPFVYAQTSPDFLRLVKRVHDLSAFHPDGVNMLIKVVAAPYEQWPLPWYLRDMRRVGYWTDAAGAGGFDGIPVIIASQENAGVLQSILGDHFEAEFYGLRPDVVLTVFIDRPLWERFLSAR